MIHALGEGKVRLRTVNRTRDVVLDLQVLFIPKVTKNLLSVPAMNGVNGSRNSFSLG